MLLTMGQGVSGAGVSDASLGGHTGCLIVNQWRLGGIMPGDTSVACGSSSL